MSIAQKAVETRIASFLRPVSTGTLTMNSEIREPSDVRFNSNNCEINVS